MKRTVKLLGIIALVAAMGFFMIGCDNSGSNCPMPGGCSGDDAPCGSPNCEFTGQSPNTICTC